MDQTRARRYQTPDSEKTDACRQPSPSWLSRTRIIRTAGAKLRVNWNDDGLQRRVEPQHVCLRSAQRGFAPSSTEQDTSCGSCRPCCGTAGQPGWRAQTPHGHPRWSWPSTRGTCRQRSSYGSPHPIKLLAWCLVMQGGMPVLVGRSRTAAFLGSGSYLFGRNGLLAGLAKLLDRLLIVSEILLAADEDDGETLAEVQNLGDPLLKSTCQQGCADRAGYQLWARLSINQPSPGRCRGNRGSRRRSRSG